MPGLPAACLSTTTASWWCSGGGIASIPGYWNAGTLSLAVVKRLNVTCSIFIYPAIVAVVFTVLTFPQGLGQFMAGEVTACIAMILFTIF